MKTPAILILVFAGAALAACSQQQDTAPPASAAATVESAVAPAVPTIASASANAASTALPGDHASSKHYKFAIDIATLPAGEQSLAEALRTTADNAKRDFLKALPDPQQLPEFADRQFQLLLDFKLVAQTAAFTSVRETGMQDTGGAHPMPIEGSFVYARKAGKLMTLDDLFADPDSARKALAHFAHDALLAKLMADAPKPGEGSPEALREWKTNMLQMLNDGTQPTSVNYSLFVVRAGSDANTPSPGLTLIFPPYQVAPYVFGTQTVDVSASVFARLLKPEYQRDFAAP